MVDPVFAHPRLAEVYDLVEPDRGDLVAYVAMVGEFGARVVLDVGCGTGTFACLLARRGYEVIGIDPAAASLAVARRKRGARRVEWLRGEAPDLPPRRVDLATMTGNVAQVFLTDDAWRATLGALHGALRPGGRLVFEIRDPAQEAWRDWNRPQSFRRLVPPGVGPVQTWVDLHRVELPLVSFRNTFVFEADGATLTSDSTLRFRTRGEVTADLEAAGFQVESVRDAPDRPGREFVFVARAMATAPRQHPIG